MRGILRYGTHIPYRRLDRSAIGDVIGSGGGRGHRSVASYDEDTTTMAVAAGRLAMAGSDLVPAAVWLSTAEPAYLEKTNACAVHAASRLPASSRAADFGGAVRSGVAALATALTGGPTVLTVASAVRTGLPGGADEAAGGDAAAAFLVGDSADGDVIAEYLGGANATEEFLDRWRTPGAAETRQWEERFGETRYRPLAEAAWVAALDDAGVATVDEVIVAGVHPRAQKAVAKLVGGAVVRDDLTSVIGNAGAAQPGVLLADALDSAEAGRTIALVVLADGVEVVILRATGAGPRPAVATQTQIDQAGALTYAKFLQWRDMLRIQPPNRPEPNRISASAAARRNDWKYGFEASAGDASGLVHMPPSRVSVRDEDAMDAQVTVPMADATGTVVTFTVDRLVYSVSPPVVFAVIDFDGGGRMPMELTDVDADAVAIGDRVEPTFRRISTADGIHNYFWKARPVRAGSDAGDEVSDG